MQPQRRQPTRLPRPWDSPGKNTGVGCHFLLQCMTVKSERQVAQSCPTLSKPMDCSPPGSSIHGIFQARVLDWGATVWDLWGLKESDTIQVAEHSISQGGYCRICLWGSLSKPARNFTFTANLIIPALRANMRLTPTSQKKKRRGGSRGLREVNLFSALLPSKRNHKLPGTCEHFFPQGQGHRTNWSRI